MKTIDRTDKLHDLYGVRRFPLKPQRCPKCKVKSTIYVPRSRVCLVCKMRGA